MNHQILFSAITKSAYTKNDARRRLRLLKEYLEKLFYSQSRNLILSEFLKNQHVSDIDYKIISSWEKSSYSWLTPENIYDVLKNISKDINSIPSIILYIAKPINDIEKDKLGFWFRSNISPTTMLEFQNDEEKVGGCAIVNKGVYSDYSLRYFIQKNQQFIQNLLDSYATNKTK